MISWKYSPRKLLSFNILKRTTSISEVRVYDAPLLNGIFSMITANGERSQNVYCTRIIAAYSAVQMKSSAENFLQLSVQHLSVVLHPIQHYPYRDKRFLSQYTQMTMLHQHRCMTNYYLWKIKNLFFLN